MCTWSFGVQHDNMPQFPGPYWIALLGMSTTYNEILAKSSNDPSRITKVCSPYHSKSLRQNLCLIY